MALFVPPKLNALYRPRSFSRQMTMSLTNKGLLNPTGENNCFLNSTVQVLWHLNVFRRSFRMFEGHCCIGKSCIFCALKVLFTQFQHSDQSALPPDVLRNAMADCYQEQHRFQLGLMDDAAECFEKLLEQIHLHLTGSEDMDSCSTNFCLSHQKFALNILERTECTCGATSEPLAFVQFVHYISSSALVAECQKVKGVGSGTVGGETGALFSRLIKAASTVGEYRECPNYAKCKKTVSVRRILLNSPDVVCLGLIWDSDQPPVDYIMNVTHSIGLSLYLLDAFDHVVSESARTHQYDLMAVVAYYGRHYSTFCYHSALKEWIYFDDAKFRKIGRNWSDVVELIHKAHYQPLLLVYANQFAEPIDTSGAPEEVKMMSLGKPGNNSPMPVLVEEEEEMQTNQNAAEAGNKHVEISANTTSQIATNTTNQPTSQNAISRVAQPTNQIVSTVQPPQKHEAIDPLTLSIIPSARLSPQLSGKDAAVQRGGQMSSAGGHGTAGSNGLAFNRPSYQPGQSDRGDSLTQGEDLMMFSITPQAAQNAREAVRRQLSPQLVPEKANDKSADLMPLSVSPVPSKSTVQPSLEARERETLSNVGGPLPRGQPTAGTRTSQLKEGAQQNLSRQNNLSLPSVGSNKLAHEHANQFESQAIPLGNQEMPAKDLIEFSISPLNFSKVSTKYGEGESQGQPLKQHNFQTYGLAPSSEPSRAPASVSPMKYSPLTHLAKSDLPPKVQPISMQSTSPQPRPQQQSGSSSGRYPYLHSHSSPPPSEHFPTLPPTSLNQFPSTSTGAGEIAPRPRPYGNWEHFENGMTLSPNARTSQVSAREREFHHRGSGFRHSAPPQLLSTLLEPQRSKFMSPPQTHTCHHTVSPPVRNDPSHTVSDKAQKSQTLTSVLHQRHRPRTTPTSGHVSPPIVATGYSQHHSLPASSRNEPINLAGRGLTTSPPIGQNPLPVKEAHNVHQDTPKSRPLPAAGTDRKYPRLYPDPFYSTPDQVLPSQGGMKGLEPSRLDAGVARQTSHKPPQLSTPESDRKQAATTGKLVTVPSPPITGDDPLYAVPSKVMERSKVPQPVGMLATSDGSGGGRGGGGRREEGEKGATMSLGTPAIMALPESMRTELVDAMDKWAMAEASRGDDDTVALILYSQAAGMLGKVLHDAAVASNPELRQQINGRREDMMRKCAELKPHPPPERERVSCIRCGRVRSVNEYLLCGPCALRVKMGQQ